MGRLGDLVSEEWKRAYEGERTRVRASPAELAATAGVDEPFDANARADLDGAVGQLCTRAECDDDADALVAADERRGRCRPMNKYLLRILGPHAQRYSFTSRNSHSRNVSLFG